jgi:phosphatidylserine/phosphatidylglycerophosphate/cardiolipin synthase-like enzyme
METPEKDLHLSGHSVKIASAQFAIQTNAGKELSASIRAAQHSVRVISPFLGTDQVETLLDKYRETISVVKLITRYPDRDYNLAQKEALKKLIFPVKGADGKMNYTCPLDVVVCTGKFLHAKLYLIDDNTAYIGSLNFTGRGMLENYETCLKIDDEAAVKELCEYYDKLFAEIRFKWNITELRQKLYADTKPYWEKKLENDSGLHE